MKRLTDEIACFYCSHALPDDLTQLETGIWIAECPTCGVVNTLTRAKADASTFVVSGGFLNMQKRT